MPDAARTRPCGRREFKLVKSLTVAAAFLCVTTATSAASETWTCSYVGQGNEADIMRFEVSPPDIIENVYKKRYPILENNDYGLVAASPISQTEKGDKAPTVGVTTLVINKGTGEFWLSIILTGHGPAVNKPVQGKCLKN